MKSMPYADGNNRNIPFIPPLFPRAKSTRGKGKKGFRTAWDALTGPGGIFVAGNNQVWRIDRRRNK